MLTAEEITKLLNLKPLPVEGGLFEVTYKSDEVIAKGALPIRYTSERSLGSAIYYMLTPETFSAMHRLKSDEIYHFYLGDPVTMLQLHPDGSSEVITLGHDIAKGGRPQVVMPHGVWQGAFLNNGGEFALMGTTMSPGYEDDDFELGVRDELVKLYPERREMIIRLTR